MKYYSLIAVVMILSVNCTIKTESKSDPNLPPTPYWSCNEEADQNRAVFKDAFEFGTSSSGLWVDTDEAKDFAYKMSSKYCARQAFEAFKAAFIFAQSSQGLWVDKAEARAFGNRISNQPNPVTAFNCYKEEFSFACSSRGLWLDKEGAHNHAVKACRIR